jgi:pyruvate dehydrogenase E2 component (dihydrolipoamide acetyltransferase)
VQEIRVKEGDKIKVGQVIFTVDGAEAKSSPAPSHPAAPSAAPTPKEKPIVPASSNEVAAGPPQPAIPSAPQSTPGASEFKLPELGENISQGDLVRLMVAPGTKVSEGQPVMELETDKAVVEVPSSVSGVVKEVKVKEGEKIKVGQVIFTLEGGALSAKPARLRTARRSPRISSSHSRRGEDRRTSPAARSATADCPVVQYAGAT